MRTKLFKGKSLVHGCNTLTIESSKKLEHTKFVKKSKLPISEILHEKATCSVRKDVSRSHKMLSCEQKCSKSANCSFYLVQSVPIFATNYNSKAKNSKL